MSYNFFETSVFESVFKNITINLWMGTIQNRSSLLWRIDIHTIWNFEVFLFFSFYFLTNGTEKIDFKWWQWRSESRETWILDLLKIVQRKD